MRKITRFLIVFLAFYISSPYSQASWARLEKSICEQNLLKNVSAKGAAEGSVIASPSTGKNEFAGGPPYFYHWIRDAALTMNVVTELYERETDPARKEKLLGRLKSYIRFSLSNQNTKTLTGLGEPKFEADGRAFNDSWGRPQNDGPALRAITVLHILKHLDPTSTETQIAETVIKADLEYVATHWKDPSFDLWEEIKGDHFYTRMVQRRALEVGTAHYRAARQDDLAAQLEQQGVEASKSLEAFWDPEQGIVRESLNVEGEVKRSGLDSAVILAALHSSRDGSAATSSHRSVDRLKDPAFESFSITDPRILETAARLRQVFHDLYPINKNGLPSPAIGRYPEDVYYGGNPWVINTLALAELHYRLANYISKNGVAGVIENGGAFFQGFPKDAPSLILMLHRRADEYVQSVTDHSFPDGSLSEQIDKQSGYMVSAPDLTWNYAAFLTAMWASE